MDNTATDPTTTQERSQYAAPSSQYAAPPSKYAAPSSQYAAPPSKQPPWRQNGSSTQNVDTSSYRTALGYATPTLKQTPWNWDRSSTGDLGIAPYGITLGHAAFPSKQTIMQPIQPLSEHSPEGTAGRLHAGDADGGGLNEQMRGSVAPSSRFDDEDDHSSMEVPADSIPRQAHLSTRTWSINKQFLGLAADGFNVRNPVHQTLVNNTPTRTATTKLAGSIQMFSIQLAKGPTTLSAELLIELSNRQESDSLRGPLNKLGADL